MGCSESRNPREFCQPLQTSQHGTQKTTGKTWQY
jgi:hypothetical protein